MVVFPHLANGQNLYDYYYMMGIYNGLVSFANPDTVTATYPVSYIIGYGESIGFICDKNGNPQLYTNGAQIGNLYGDTLLNTGMLDTAIEQEYWDGAPFPQGAIILPKNDCQYYCIYYDESDSLYNIPIAEPDKLCYALVDMCANSGHGNVLSAKNILYKGIMGDGRMTACRHANGRDWWLVIHGFNDSSYLKFLVTPDTITGPLFQAMGPFEGQPDVLGQAVFSADGSKYASITGGSPLVLLDFDRCTGEFSNPVSFKVAFLPPYQINGTGALGCAFSSSGRFMYVSEYNQIVQFDLNADSIENTMTLIAQYDSSYEWYDPFNLMYLAPNNKIYIQNWDASPKCYHVINDPDSLGSKCNYDKFGLCLDSIGAYPISNMPHYRLGPLIGSGCDTIISDAVIFTSKLTLRVSPNPTDKYFYADMTTQGYYEFDLLNITGQVADTRLTTKSATFETSQMSNGLYFLRVIDKTTGSEIAVTKVVVGH